MSKRTKDALWWLAVTALASLDVWVQPRWFVALAVLLLSGYGFCIAQSYWWRGEVYRYGGVPKDEERTPAEDAAAVMQALDRIGAVRAERTKP